MIVDEKVSFKTIGLVFLITLPISYLFLMVLVGASAWFFVEMTSPGAIETNPEAGLFVSLLAIWFPLWPAPMLATFISLRYLASKLKA